MSSKTIRLAITDGTEYRSSVWRIWVQKNDIYLATRNGASLSKVSLHESGKWRYAFTRESGITSLNSDDRVERRWNRPAEFRSGWTLAFSIIIPNSEPQQPFTFVNKAILKDTIFIPIPKLGFKCQIALFIVKPGQPEDVWKKVIGNGTKHGVLDLKNKDHVLVCSLQSQMESGDLDRVKEAKKNLRVEYASMPSDIQVSLAEYDMDPNGNPFIYDLPVGWENVHVVAKNT